MANQIGPLLKAALDQVGSAADVVELSVAAARIGDAVLATRSIELPAKAPEDPSLPVVIKMPNIPPEKGEHWPKYRDRVLSRLAPLQQTLQERYHAESVPIVSATSLKAVMPASQVSLVARRIKPELVELDPLVQVVAMYDVGVEIELSRARGSSPPLDGSGVRIAVLDSGIDVLHPWLKVTQSIPVSSEPVEISGSHGTHCAGSIASRDTTFQGIAPGVDLINIKVLRSDGRGRHTDISRGVDAAIDAGAHVISLSAGFNHLPSSAADGHGWECATGACTLCTAVENAVQDGVFCVVAAGNEHETAAAVRGTLGAGAVASEISCPGQSSSALTVGALNKRTFDPASFSSWGPTAAGVEKPDVCAPGVNIISTVPLPRDSGGHPAPRGRNTLFAGKSGTSMATPIIAGVVALLIQRELLAGRPTQPERIRELFFQEAVATIPLPIATVGKGRVTLANW